MTMSRRKEGLLVPNRSLCGRCIAGIFTIPIAILVTFVLTQIPWDAVYRLGWYQQAINIVSVFSSNVSKIPDTSNPFPEYSIAFLGCINTLGPFYALLGLYCGIKHVENTSGIPAMRARSTKLAGILLTLILVILVLMWGAFYFSGASTIFPGRFYKSEWRFVSLFTFLWFVISMFCFGVSAITSVLYKRIKER